MSKYKKVGELNGETLYITSKGREIEIQDTLTEMGRRSSELDGARGALENVQSMLRNELVRNEELDDELDEVNELLEELENDYIELINLHSAELGFNRTLAKFAVYFTGIAAGCAITMTALSLYATYPNLFVFPF